MMTTFSAFVLAYFKILIQGIEEKIQTKKEKISQKIEDWICFYRELYFFRAYQQGHKILNQGLRFFFRFLNRFLIPIWVEKSIQKIFFWSVKIFKCDALVFIFAVTSVTYSILYLFI